MPAYASIFIDGSGFEVGHPPFRVAWWAVVITDENGNMLSALYGAVPLQEAPGQLAHGGEDHVVMMLSDHAVIASEVPLYIDCKATVNRARHAMTGAAENNARAHWWRRKGDAFEHVRTRKVAAHTSERAVREGGISHQQRVGNMRMQIGERSYERRISGSPEHSAWWLKAARLSRAKRQCLAPPSKHK